MTVANKKTGAVSRRLDKAWATLTATALSSLSHLARLQTSFTLHSKALRPRLFMALHISTAPNPPICMRAPVARSAFRHFYQNFYFFFV